MRENRGFLIACCLLWASVLAVASCGDDTDIGFLLVLFLLPATIVGWVILFIIAGVRFFRRDYLPLRKRAIPFYFLIAPVIVAVVAGEVGSEIGKESTWLAIKMYDFQGSDNFQFMKDGTYSQWRESPLGSSARATGRYERRDSILILHPQVADDTTGTIRLAIRPYVRLKKQHDPLLRVVMLDTTLPYYFTVI